MPKNLEKLRRDQKGLGDNVISIPLAIRLECVNCSMDTDKPAMLLERVPGGDIHDSGILMQCPVCTYRIYLFLQEK